MKESQSDYKEKVFDSSAMQFCLSVVDFAEVFSSEPQFLRQATLDALSFSQSLQEVAAYLEALSKSSHSLGSLERAQLLQAVHQMGHRAPQEVLNFLITVRSLGEANSFHFWNDFFNCTKVVCENSTSGLEDFFLTVRNLATNDSFSLWKPFFSMTKQIVEKSAVELSKAFLAIRHCLASLKTENSVHGTLRMLAEFPQYSEAFALGQLDSKQWLIEEAIKCWGKSWGKVFVLAGWVGLLPRMLFENQIETTMIRSFDIDEEACRASELLNQTEVQNDWLYKSSVADITHMKYPSIYKVRRKDGSECELFDLPDVIINTS